MKKALVIVLMLFVGAMADAQVSVTGSGIAINCTPPANMNQINISNMISPGKVVEYYTGKVSYPGNQTVTLADITPGSSGTVTALQMDLYGIGANAKDLIVHVYYDGSATAAFSFDVGELGVLDTGTYSFGDTGATVGSMSGHVNFILAYPMYFSSEWKVTMDIPSAYTSVDTYTEVRYTTGYTSSLRLYGTNQPLATAPSTTLHTANLPMLNLASGSGTIAAVFMTTMGATDWTYLESNVQAFVGGEGTASYNAGGTEDFFGSGWYFDGPSFAFSTPYSYLAEVSSSTHGVAVNINLLTYQGGIPFSGGVLFGFYPDAQKKGQIDTAVQIGYLCLYYQ